MELVFPLCKHRILLDFDDLAETLSEEQRVLHLLMLRSVDAVYVLGETKPELGGGEYYAMLDAVGNNVPKVDVPTIEKRLSIQHILCT